MILNLYVMSMNFADRIFCNVVIEETEYEYSGSDEEEENRGDDRESR